jgi:DNA-binding MarR family transcriptional regulator
MVVFCNQRITMSVTPTTHRTDGDRTEPTRATDPSGRRRVPHHATSEVVSALSSLIRASRSIARQRQAQLGASGTPLAILKVLATQPGADRPGDLAQATGVAPSVVSRALTHLEEDGLVARHRDEEDARACHITLTAEGRSQLATISDLYAALLDDALTDLTDDDVERLPSLLHTLEQALRRAGERAAPPRHTPLARSLVAAHSSAPIHESL